MMPTIDAVVTQVSGAINTIVHKISTDGIAALLGPDAEENTRVLAMYVQDYIPPSAVACSGTHRVRPQIISNTHLNRRAIAVHRH